MQVFTLLLAALPAVFAGPVINKRQTADTIPNQWIVKLNDNAVLDKVLPLVKVLGINPTFQYDAPGIKGFAFKGPEALVNALSKIGALKSVEPDTIVSINAPIPETEAEEEAYIEKRAMVTQSNAPWQLGRIDSIERPTSSPYSYTYDNSAGAGTVVYVIDTGINTEHRLFEGRAIIGANFVQNENSSDLHGHGTHCAGSVGSSNYGVAKKATLIAVKVLNQNGTGASSQTMAGVNWAVNDAKSRGQGVGKSVISMSLGGAYNANSNSAVKAAVDAGIFVAVAAGNNNADAANYSPGSEPSVCTVAASDINDKRASFSNYGSLIDIFGPGVSIKSTWIGSTSAVNTLSGTSMATPHIAGLAAYLIGQGITLSPANMCARLQSMSAKDKITDTMGSVNYLANNGNGL
jgi:subtilisin family serine protease